MRVVGTDVVPQAAVGRVVPLNVVLQEDQVGTCASRDRVGSAGGLYEVASSTGLHLVGAVPRDEEVPSAVADQMVIRGAEREDRLDAGEAVAPVTVGVTRSNRPVAPPR